MDSPTANHQWKIFDELKPDLKPKEVMEEANRCLFCFDAPCAKACPTGIDIPLFIKKITTGNMKGSARVIMDANPMGATCARVCPTEELCEGACVLNDASLPIMIGDLQRHATNWAMKNQQQLFEAGEANGKTVAIIGGGPAGLSSARELARLGYKVTVYEKNEKAGGLDTYGIVPFRLPQEISLWEVSQIEKLGVTIQTNTEVGKDIPIATVLNDFDAVILAIGMANVPPLSIPGEDLDGVYDAIQLIENVKDGRVPNHFKGKKAVVIGAGNTAIDAATCLKRLGAASVKMIYRRSEAEMTAYPFEFSFAKQDGIEFNWLAQPKRIIDDGQNHVAKLECVSMELGAMDASGRRRPIEIENSDFMIKADVVVKAIGQSRYTSFIEALGLEHEQGIVKVDAETYQTSNPKVYAAGDVIFGNGIGEAMVVAAAEQGKRAAYAIHDYMLSKI
ncbi:NAD(P)-dependent oxidoreductase [Sporolactobacillus laevolacticus]|uniref:Dihydropyrimidine dehydrogenase subunit A n=1 Tax=Sporolactobacillus laevolacticus DSM 442 TaxID=1395513 RepID=V6J2J7_9BACL|nr:NAD(P)-dependent oxidoreductase [Sporolactobacillus laevolacticus]EST10984.1 dihydropyrimidine dehydrogenase subunit A [Sporolactobacillus laevolacticus DSM 442]